VVADTLKLLGDRFLREIEVRFEPTPDLPQISYPRDFIQQILLNFIFNAAESLSTRKEIILSTRWFQSLPPSLVLTPSKPGPCACVLVQDFGCGIPAENLPRIFEPFFTTKAFSARRGTGLGLSMVYELAKKINAGLAVESVVNQGSTFTLILPLGPNPGAKADPL
jgi:signal transduction histidine kinase